MASEAKGLRMKGGDILSDSRVGPPKKTLPRRRLKWTEEAQQPNPAPGPISDTLTTKLKYF